ncbi:hypothetical protein [Kutzneria buriramensis]|uniref:Uncharacterized protein n=1 Tax=Kutzneria buriramensis TaxID=1045776 RepID=A0A3E0HKK3_9PSEU|nr:hypothetical protein [Kutzneria buriramensis]REH47022.1 hypothetical protein BCF44_106186 [Kutzneria buriramensis]
MDFLGVELSDALGLEELRDELHQLAAQGRGDEVVDVIDDAVETFAIVGEPAVAAKKIHERFDGTATSLAFFRQQSGTPEAWQPLYEELRRRQAATK